MVCAFGTRYTSQLRVGRKAHSDGPVLGLISCVEWYRTFDATQRQVRYDWSVHRAVLIVSSTLQSQVNFVSDLNNQVVPKIVQHAGFEM